MAEWKELCLHKDVEQLILARIENSELSASMLRGIQGELVSRPETGAGQVGEVAREYTKATGLEVQLRNLVYQELIQLHYSQRVLPLLPPSLHCKEPLDFLQVVQENWQERLRRQVNCLCSEQGAVLARKRTLVEQQWIRKRWNGLGTDFPIPSDLKYIYTPKDLLEVIVQIHSPNAVRNGHSSDMGCGLMSIQLGSKSLYTLRETYSILRMSALQVETALRALGESPYNEKASKVIERGLYPLAREVCKRGCPVTHRRQLWSLALGVDPGQQENAFHFEKLKSAVVHTHLLLEKLLVKEVKETTASDDNYFVFEDTILQVLFAFLHDYSLLDQLEHVNVSPMKANIPDGTDGPQCEVAYPPSGVIPFHGISSYVAPLGYMFARPDHLYALFKQLYIRYFVHLHSISSHPQGIVGLCCLFETLLLARQPELFQHLTRIEAYPLHLVYGWLTTAFASALDCREVLLLWDRVIGFDSVEIIAVLAVAVLEFRALNLFQATCVAEAEEILSDLRCLKVLPLLQQTLFL